MSNLRPIKEVYGARICDENHRHQYILLKEWMLKPLWVQNSLGIAIPTHKLPGVVAQFNSSPNPVTPKAITLAFGPRRILIANKIDEPGFEYELQIVS